MDSSWKLSGKSSNCKAREISIWRCSTLKEANFSKTCAKLIVESIKNKERCTDFFAMGDFNFNNENLTSKNSDGREKYFHWHPGAGIMAFLHESHVAKRRGKSSEWFFLCTAKN